MPIGLTAQYGYTIYAV